MVKKKIKQFENEVVLHQNVARLRGRLTSLQSRSMLAILKRANDLVLMDKNLKDFEIDTKIFLELIQFKDTGSHRAKLEKIAKHLRALMTQTFEWGTDSVIEEAVFIQQIRITEDNVNFKFSDYIREHIKPISNALIIKDFELIQSFRSEYARQLFKHIMAWEKKGTLELTLKDLRDFLGVPNSKSYERLDNLQRKVIKVAVDEINQKKPILQLAYLSKKKGREVIGFCFAWIPEKSKQITNNNSGGLFEDKDLKSQFDSFIGLNIEKNKAKILCITPLSDDKYRVDTDVGEYTFHSFEMLQTTIAENNQ